MRVGIDYRPALVNREGIGRYTRELVRGLIDQGFDGNLGLFGYTLAPMRFDREELGLAGSRAELLRLRLPSRILPWLLRRLGKGADDAVGGADVFHHTAYHHLPVRRAIEVVTIHDCIALRPGETLEPATAERMAAALRAVAQRARRVLVPTEYVGAEVVMNLGVWPSRISVTGLGCDHVARHLPASLPPARDPYVLTVARVEPRKNHLRMLAAFERLVAEGFPHRWVVAGPPGHRSEEFARAVERSPARARVDWRRHVPDAELPALYAGAEVFLFASLDEGFGLPPLEAMACGTAVVTSAVTAMPEVCGDAAWLVEPTDEERIFEALRRLVAEPELRRDHELRGRQRARRYTWRDAAKHTLLAYQRAGEPEEEEGGLRRSL